MRSLQRLEVLNNAFADGLTRKKIETGGRRSVQREKSHFNED
jgi:hypothetical protein